ncbi:MAG: hypothetical protein ACTHM6_16400, partial [Tepidisphaeraceae bacterium]
LAFAGPAIERRCVIRQEQLDVRSVCVQFQPDRVVRDESRVREALRVGLPDAETDVGEEEGRYENFMFKAASPIDAMSQVQIVFDSPEVGSVARSSCIVTCEGEHGWVDYFLLHHYDRTLVVDAPAVGPAE